MLEQLRLQADLSSEGNQGRTQGCWGGGDTEHKDILTHRLAAREEEWQRGQSIDVLGCWNGSWDTGH